MSLIGSFIWDGGKVYFDDNYYHSAILQEHPELLEDWSHLIFGQVHEYGDTYNLEFYSDYMNDEEGYYDDETDDYVPPEYNQKLDQIKFQVCQDVADKLHIPITEHGVVCHPKYSSNDPFLDFYRKYKVEQAQKQEGGPISRFPIPDEAVRRSIYYHQCPMCRGYLRNSGDFYRCEDCPYEVEWPNNEHEGSVKEASLPYKFVWADGQFTIGPGWTNIHHYELLKQMGLTTMPKNLVAGVFSTSDYHNDEIGNPLLHVEVLDQWGNYPSIDELKQLIRNHLQNNQTPQ